MRRVVAAWAVGVGLLSPVAILCEEPPAIPVYHEPHHRQVFQYGPTRILDLQLPPGTTTWFHTHEAPILYIYLSSSPTRTQILGQEWSAPVSLQSLAPPTDHSPSLASPVVGSDTSYYVHPVTHRLENIGDRLTRSIVVLNETRGDESGTTAETAGFKWKAELINRWFRAYRQTLASGTSAGPHRHHAPVVLVQTSVGRGLASGAARFELNEPGQWAFFDAGDTHEIRNTGDVPLEVVEVELRQPKLKN